MSEGDSKLLAWWQLLRAGNVFTAVSNVIAGYLISQGSWQPIAPLVLLILASALLYEAGMVLNDVFDAELDAKERPERPIPSGRISRRTAGTVGWTLLVLGMLAGGLASVLVGSIRPALTAAALAACIVGYDTGLKSTFLGPWVMGACRALNVMLGAHNLEDFWLSYVGWYAVAIGVYTVGLTYFARTENKVGWNVGNVFGSALMIANTIFVTIMATAKLQLVTMYQNFLFALNLFLWFGLWSGLRTPRPIAFRRTVSRMIVCFILMDALMAFAFVGTYSAVAVLSLLIPTWIASRWAPMT